MVPVPCHVTFPEPDPASKVPGKVPDPPVTVTCEHELKVIVPEVLPVTTVQITGTFCGPSVVEVDALFEVVDVVEVPPEVEPEPPLLLPPLPEADDVPLPPSERSVPAPEPLDPCAEAVAGRLAG